MQPTLLRASRIDSDHPPKAYAVPLAFTRCNVMPGYVRTLMLDFSVSSIYVIFQPHSSHVLAYSAARQSRGDVNVQAQYLRPNSPYGLHLYTFAVSGSISEALIMEARLASASALSASSAVPVLPFAGSSHEITCTTVTKRQNPLRHHGTDKIRLVGLGHGTFNVAPINKHPTSSRLRGMDIYSRKGVLYLHALAAR